MNKTALHSVIFLAVITVMGGIVRSTWSAVSKVLMANDSLFYATDNAPMLIFLGISSVCCFLAVIFYFLAGFLMVRQMDRKAMTICSFALCGYALLFAVLRLALPDFSAVLAYLEWPVVIFLQLRSVINWLLSYLFMGTEVYPIVGVVDTLMRFLSAAFPVTFLFFRKRLPQGSVPNYSAGAQ